MIQTNKSYLPASETDASFFFLNSVMEIKSIVQPLGQTNIFLFQPVLTSNVIVCFTGDTAPLF